MTCEDVPARIAWEIQLYEPCTRMWMPRCYGRATTTADPKDVARAALAAYLAITTVWPGQDFRATAQADGGMPVTVPAGQLPEGPQVVRNDARQALPLYLRNALAPATTANSSQTRGG